MGTSVGTSVGIALGISVGLSVGIYVSDCHLSAKVTAGSQQEQNVKHRGEAPSINNEFE